jgi:LPLT family lysophospholipid transporter-like MFS transporter
VTQALRHRHGFAALLAAQFCSSLADNALLIVAIALLAQRHAADWATPALRLFFYLSYVLLGPFAGAVADAWPKSRILFATNLVKLAGALLLLLQLHPLAAYALVGAGAAAYSPAKYGILAELLPAADLVRANAWIEVSTVLSIILGVALGSLLIAPPAFMQQWLPAGLANLSDPTRATLWVGMIYALAAVCAAGVPVSPASDPAALSRPERLVAVFRAGVRTLFSDRPARLSLCVTSLFWSVSAVLQFIILRWAEQRLQLPLAQAALLQVAVAAGMVCGAVAAGRWITLERTLSVLPVGLAIGLLVLFMTLVTQVWLAACVLALIGLLSGVFLVPMNALLQHRGLQLLHPGQSIAVQNCTENLACLIVLAVYGALLMFDAPLLPVIAGFGSLVTVVMLAVLLRRPVSLG